MNRSPDGQNEDREPGRVSGAVHIRPDFAELRSQKRELLAEQESLWAEGKPALPEDILQRWPTDPQTDADVASVLFADLMQRRARGEDPGLDEYSERFPEHQQSLAGLLSQQNLLHSISVASSPPRCTLRFPEVGDELFGYRFRAELGRGSFARVFLAEEINLAGRAVAVKVSAIEGKEHHNLAEMQHTHIVPIYHEEEDVRSGLRAVRMPYFGGASLSCVMQELWSRTKHPVHGRQLVEALETVQSPALYGRPDGGRTPLALLRGETYIRAVVWVIARLAEGLQHAHQREVLHRDIKPSNILLTAEGQPMLLDFNLSQNQSGDAAEAVLGGTVAYMSPEHLRAMVRRGLVPAKQVDNRSDIYSLGMVLYELLTGQKPFEQSGSYSAMPLQLEALAAERSKPGLSVRSLRPDVPWSVESILRKCLAPNPADRYQQAEELAEDLRCFLEDRPLKHALELSRAERIGKWTRRHPRLTYAGTVALIAALLLAGAGTALVTVQHRLTGAQAQERRRAFDVGIKQALCLVNTTVEMQDHFSQGVKVCEETLALYDVLSGDAWEEPADWLRLSDDERRGLKEDIRELLMLLAAARVRVAPTDRAVLRQSLAILDRAETITGLPSSRALWMDRARYHKALGESVEASAAQRKAETIPVTSARDHYELAIALARKGRTGDYTRALAELHKALALDPRHYWARLQRGICHTELGELVLAAGDFGHCTGLRPEFAWGHFNLGMVQGKSDKLSEAVASYTRALDCDPALVPALRNRGLACLKLKRYAEALADLDQAIAEGKNDAPMQASRAMALEGLGQHKDADAAFQLAWKTDAELPAAIRRSMRASYGFAVTARLPQKARQAFEEVLRDEPQNKEVLYGLATLAMSKGNASDTLRFFDRALEADPHFLDARRYRAVQLARQGSLKKAAEDINWCLAKEPHSGASLYAAACVAALASQQLGDTKHAEQARDFLAQAFDQGVGLDKADKDPDLAGIRGDARIRQRVLQAKANNER